MAIEHKAVTASTRKLLESCACLPDAAEVAFAQADKTLQLRSSKSRFFCSGFIE